MSLMGAHPAICAPETIGGGTVASPAAGPPPSFGLGGKGMVLVKNWHFGADGTIKNYADMSENFFYHDQFGTYNNGGQYGSNIVAPDFGNSLGGQPIEGVNSPPVRKFTKDSLITLLTPLDGANTVEPSKHNAGNGSFMAKWRLPNGGSLLGRDIVWETRVRYMTPPYFWFAIWTAGNKWKWDGHSAQGTEQDLVESFGYDNGGGNTNYDGRYWHSNAVAGPTKDTVDYGGWGTAMEKQGIKSYDATQYHIWTWVYKKDNTYAMYVDGTLVQGGRDYYWTYGNGPKDEPIDMDFLFDAGWGHNKVGSVNKPLPASALAGKYYEWNYSRVYLSGGGKDATALRAVTASGAKAQFVKIDRATGGSWKGVYGADGYALANGGDPKTPTYGTLHTAAWTYSWSDGVIDQRAAQKPSGNDRIAAQWGGDVFDIDCNLTDGKSHQVALYGLDWDRGGRDEDIEVQDAGTHAVLDTQNLNTFVNGAYALWNIKGHVIFHVVKRGGSNCAIAGIFCDPVAKGGVKAVRK